MWFRKPTKQSLWEKDGKTAVKLKNSLREFPKNDEEIKPCTILDLNGNHRESPINIDTIAATTISITTTATITTTTTTTRTYTPEDPLEVAKRASRRRRTPTTTTTTIPTTTTTTTTTTDEERGRWVAENCVDEEITSSRVKGKPGWQFYDNVMIAGGCSTFEITKTVESTSPEGCLNLAVQEPRSVHLFSFLSIF